MVRRLLAGPTVCVRSLGPIWWREWPDSLQVLLSFPHTCPGTPPSFGGEGENEKPRNLFYCRRQQNPKTVKAGMMAHSHNFSIQKAWGKGSLVWHQPSVKNSESKAILGTYPDPVSVNPAWGGGRASLEKRNASKSFRELIHIENKKQKVSGYLGHWDGSAEKDTCCQT